MKNVYKGMNFLNNYIKNTFFSIHLISIYIYRFIFTSILIFNVVFYSAFLYIPTFQTKKRMKLHFTYKCSF